MSFKTSLRTGFSFGLTSGIITTLGLMVGLDSATASKLVVIGGILTIAVADAFSDSLGMHISQESENEHTTKEIWVATIATFLTKFIFALTFLIPVLLLPVSIAVLAAVVWGMFLLFILSAYIAKREKIKQWKVIGEHLSIAVLVIIITNFVGGLIKQYFQ
jgi:vacuolar iron transporter family protein